MSNYFIFTRLEVDNVRDNSAPIQLIFKLQAPPIVYRTWALPDRLNSTEYPSQFGLTRDRVAATTSQLLGVVL